MPLAALVLLVQGLGVPGEDRPCEVGGAQVRHIACGPASAARLAQGDVPGLPQRRVPQDGQPSGGKGGAVAQVARHRVRDAGWVGGVGAGHALSNAGPGPDDTL